MTYIVYSCSILSAEFLRVSINDAGDKDAAILSKAKARMASLGNGEDIEVSTNCMLVISHDAW